VRNIYWAIFVFAIFLSSCGEPEGFVISGKITNAGGKKLYLDELNVSAIVPVDSVELKNDGTFEFSRKISYPNFYLLRLNDKNFITLLVDTLERISIKGDFANFSRDYTVEGSQGSALVQELNNQLTTTRHKIDSLQSRINTFRNFKDYGVQGEKWEKEVADLRQNQIKYSTDFVQKHPFSMASVLALYQKFDDSELVVQDLYSLKVVASALNSIYPKSGHVKALYMNTQQLMKQGKNMMMKDFISENGNTYPEIVLPDAEGRKIALSSIKAKVILIQFWSAQDRVSRIQNEALVELYKKYKSRGLEIYQVSIDTNKDIWKAAIAQDGLAWINVGDMEGSISAINSYNVTSLPFNYILDKDRNIRGKNFAGPALDEAVRELTK